MEIFLLSRFRFFLIDIPITLISKMFVCRFVFMGFASSAISQFVGKDFFGNAFLHILFKIHRDTIIQVPK